jgi:8-oxo-dGTP pyrophosphatase MutT (NUDIX family)
VSGKERRRRVAVEAAGGVVVRRGKEHLEVLVVHRPRRADWSLPKGKLDPGEDHETAAVREILEETGVAAVVEHELPETRYRVAKGNKRVRWYRMTPADGDTSRLRPHDPAEIDDVRWVPIGELDRLLTYRQDRETVAAALEGDR